MQDYAERHALRSEMRVLAKEERQRQQKAVGEVLQKAAVVCATLTGTMSHDLAPLSFNLVVIDEAAQVLKEAAIRIGANLKLVLASVWLQQREWAACLQPIKEKYEDILWQKEGLSITLLLVIEQELHHPFLTECTCRRSKWPAGRPSSRHREWCWPGTICSCHPPSSARLLQTRWASIA